MHWLAGLLADSQTNLHTDFPTDWLTHSLTHSELDWPADQPNDWLAVWLAAWLTHRETGLCIKKSGFETWILGTKSNFICLFGPVYEPSEFGALLAWGCPPRWNWPYRALFRSVIVPQPHPSNYNRFWFCFLSFAYFKWLHFSVLVALNCSKGSRPPVFYVLSFSGP